MKLTDGERSTLRAVCDAIFPDAGGESAFYRRKASDLSVDVVLAETVESALQPSGAEEFRRVLRVLDSRLYDLLLSQRPSRFSSMSVPDRQRYLARWRDSAIPLKRTAFQALKRLACFLSYTVTDQRGSNPNWSDIGYPGPEGTPPVAMPEQLRISPIILDGDSKLDCDVCIVGSGAGGSVIADRLSEAGLRVVVVEQGSYDTSETFKRSELPMMQKLFQQSGTAATKDLSFVLLAGRGVGGGTTVNWNTCLRPPSRVLREWETDFGIDGVAQRGFESYLDAVWAALRVNIDESQRNGNNQALWDGCVALGYKEGVDFEVIQRNAVGCQERCDYCTYGCTYACKQSTPMNYLPAAYRRGAKFLFDTRVERVVIEAGVARGVVGTAKIGDRTVEVEVKARAVVVACGGVETPALLLRSGVKDSNIGRYLRLDPTVAVGGVFPKTIAPWAGPPQTVAVWKFIDIDGSYHGFWVEAAPVHPGLFALSIPWVDGRQHKEFMQRYYSRSTASIVLLRERSSGVVSIDRYGFPVVSYKLEARDRSMLVRGMEETARILAAAGAVRLWTTHNRPIFVGDGMKPLGQPDLDRFAETVRSEGIEYNRMMLFSAHLMGSCRMSADPSKGPTAPSGELHQVRNLFVGDACAFPTSPAVNPMITIMAMASRTAESIISAHLKGL
ncbi:MAG: FAD-dependent oxidoreductase [Nitrososphaerales archaeon]|nr:FAD-dependent oxidoreductase [Nitrososphaerales archaeon]